MCFIFSHHGFIHSAYEIFFKKQMYTGYTDLNPFHIIMIYLRTQTDEWYSN